MIYYKDMCFEGRKAFLLFKCLEELENILHIDSDGLLTEEEIMFIWNEFDKTKKLIPVPVYNVKWLDE